MRMTVPDSRGMPDSRHAPMFAGADSCLPRVLNIFPIVLTLSTWVL